MKPKMEIDAGSVTFATDKFRFYSKDYGQWEVNLHDLVLIGEYTTQDGPLMEDHFLVLISKSGNEYEFPVAANGIEEMIQKISLYFGKKVDLELNSSVDFKSRIIVPSYLNGQPLYVFVSEKKSLIGKIFSGTRVERLLSDNAKSVLKAEL